MGLIHVPAGYWPELNIRKDQDRLLALLVHAQGDVIPWTGYDAPAPLIPQRLVLVDGDLRKDGLPLRIVGDYTGTPIVRGEKDVVPVRSGYLTVIPLQAWYSEWCSTNAIQDEGTSFRYEDSPYDGHAGRRGDIHFGAKGIVEPIG